MNYLITLINNKVTEVRYTRLAVEMSPTTNSLFSHVRFSLSIEIQSQRIKF
jgi:hypothetical protein